MLAEIVGKLIPVAAHIAAINPKKIGGFAMDCLDGGNLLLRFCKFFAHLRA